MNKVIKLNSDNAGSFNASQNIVNFTIPSGTWNLRDSYINLNCVVTTEDASPATGEGVYPVALRLKDQAAAKITNSTLVRDARLTCDRKGVIEDISRVDQLTNLLHHYSHSIDETESENYIDMNVFSGKTNQPYNFQSIFRDIVKLGDFGLTPSRDLTISPIQLRLSDLFNFCNTTEFDTQRAGDAHIRLRLNLDLVEAYQTTDAMVDDSNQMKDVDASLGDADEVITSHIFTDLSQSPYYLGQKVQVNATGATNGGTAPIAVSTGRIITSITWDRMAGSTNIGRLILQFDTAWGVQTPLGTYENIEVTAVEADTVTVDFDYAEIVLKEAENSGVDQIAYDTYNVEQNNGNQLANYSNVFQIEPECSNVMLVMNQEATGNITSTNLGFSSYTIRLNNEDLVDNRTVEYNSSLYRDRLNMTMGNMDMPLHNFTSHIGETGEESDRYTATDLRVVTIMNPIVPAANTQLLQLNIDASDANGTGLREISLFKQLPKIFEY